MPSQSPGQHRPGPRQPAGHSALGQSQVPGRRGAGLALQVAQHEYGAVLVGQPAQFLVQQRQEIARAVGSRHRLGHRIHLPLSRRPASGCRARLKRRLTGHAVQPVGEHLARRHRGGLADEDQKGGLKGVLGVLGVAQPAPAHAPDKGGVTAHQGRKRRPVLLLQEAREQLAIAGSVFLFGEQGQLNVLEGCLQVIGHHAVSAGRRVCRPPSFLFLAGGDFDPRFFAARQFPQSPRGINRASTFRRCSTYHLVAMVW